MTFRKAILTFFILVWLWKPDHPESSLFILDVARKTNDPGEAMLVFRNGRWTRSTQLYQAVQQSSFDDLILDENVKYGKLIDLISLLIACFDLISQSS